MDSQVQSDGRKDAMSDGALLPFGKSDREGSRSRRLPKRELKGVAMPPRDAACGIERPAAPTALA